MLHGKVAKELGEALNMILIGMREDDADWVRLVLGEPDERSIGPGESQTWVWHHRRTRREHKLGAKTEWIERITFIALTRDGRIERALIEEDRSPGWSD